jgi:IclR family mhp operon transcriptional activator
MSSSPSVQSLERGLEILSFLNQCNGSTVAEVGRGSGLARTTAFRILETLCDNGFVERSGRDGRYFLTSKVLSLSDGFDDQSWVAEIAKPYLRALAAQVVWPVVIAVPSGMSMVWRESTEDESPLALQRYAVGLRVPIAGSATGLAYLAYCSDADREQVLANHAYARDDPDWILRPDEVIAKIRARGYATYPGKWRDGTLAAPVMSEGRFLASLAVRYLRAAISDDAAAAKFSGLLRETADKIGAAFKAGVQDMNRKLDASKAQYVKLPEWEIEALAARAAAVNPGA